jgi:hypothetical protein
MGRTGSASNKSRKEKEINDNRDAILAFSFFTFEDDELLAKAKAGLMTPSEIAEHGLFTTGMWVQLGGSYGFLSGLEEVEGVRVAISGEF